MKVGVDLQAIQGSFGDRGIGLYSTHLFKSLVEDAGDIQFVWYSIPGAPLPEFARKTGPVLSMVPSRFDAWFRENAAEQNLDVFHAACPFGEWPIPRAGRMETALVATVYDLIPLKLPYYFDVPDKRYQYYSTLQILKGYDVLLAISQTVKNDAVRFLGFAPDRVHTVSAGVEPAFKELPESLKANPSPGYGIRRPFVMCTGGEDPRKNLFRLIDAFALLPPELSHWQLVIVCWLSDSGQTALRRKACEAGVGDRLVLTNYVPKSDLIALYNAADLFVFPSLAEGFGLPVLEAMACGTPVLTSNRPPLPEVGGDAVAYADPLNLTALAQAMARLMNDRVERFVMRERGLRRAAKLTWKAVARATRGAYIDAANRARARYDPEPAPAIAVPSRTVRPGGEAYSHWTAPTSGVPSTGPAAHRWPNAGHRIPNKGNSNKR